MNDNDNNDDVPILGTSPFDCFMQFEEYSEFEDFQERCVMVMNEVNKSIASILLENFVNDEGEMPTAHFSIALLTYAITLAFFTIYQEEEDLHIDLGNFLRDTQATIIENVELLVNHPDYKHGGKSFPTSTVVH